MREGFEYQKRAKTIGACEVLSIHVQDSSIDHNGIGHNIGCRRMTKSINNENVNGENASRANDLFCSHGKINIAVDLVRASTACDQLVNAAIAEIRTANGVHLILRQIDAKWHQTKRKQTIIISSKDCTMTRIRYLYRNRKKEMFVCFRKCRY